MTVKRVRILVNVVLVCAMVIHVGVAMFLHGQNPVNSAPAYVELVHAIYYLIPLIVVNLGFSFLKKR